MRAIILKITTILALVMAFTAISAQAQTSRNAMRITVPFEFNVGEKVLPAGKYTVFVENQIIRIRKTDGKANAVAIVQRTIGASHIDGVAKLTFLRYDDQSFLSQVWLAGGVGRELKSRPKENTYLALQVQIVEVSAR